VTIDVERFDGSASGSGVIIDPSGVIATAAHVVAGATTARVHLSTGDALTVEGIIDVDTQLDFALIRVAGFQLPVAVLGNSDSLVVGQRLLAIGSPMGLDATVSDGLLSSIRQDGTRRLLQLSIPVSHGSSGGPVFTEAGAVVGLVVSGIRGGGAENLNFALPINYVRGKLALAASKTPTPLSQAAIVMPPGGSTGQIGPGPGGGPETVNTTLGLDWTPLNGVEVYQEIKGEQGVRRLGLVQYSLSTDPNGQPVIVRQLRLRIRVKVAPLRTDNVADDLILTELTLGSVSHLHESARRTSYVSSVVNGQTDLLVDGRTFSWTVNDQTRTGWIPRGTLTAELIGGAVAALPDSLPTIAFIWVLDPTTGRADPMRFEFGARDTLNVRLSVDGGLCGSDAFTRDTSVAVVWVTSTVGPNRNRYPVLAERPHLRADPDEVKCMRRPGWGGAPRP